MVHWSEISDDPNDPHVIDLRQRAIDDARCAQVENRFEFFAEQCRGKRVLDIGCVAHTLEAANDAGWLHEHIRRSAAECVGVDIHSEGVRALVARGYDVVEHDITAGPGPLADRGLFDVVTCGEVIEHVHEPLGLLTSVAKLVKPGGIIILSTPNPYAPFRGVAGSRREQWENADHVAYMFPSGMSHLASLSDLELAVATTTTPTARFAQLVMTLRLKGLLVSLTGALGPLARGAHRRIRSLPTARRLPVSVLATHWRHWNETFIGETAIYVLQRPEVEDHIDLDASVARFGTTSPGG